MNKQHKAIQSDVLTADRAQLRTVTREMALQQVKQSGIKLSRLSPELRDDREIVLASVRNNGNSFG